MNLIKWTINIKITNIDKSRFNLLKEKYHDEFINSIKFSDNQNARITSDKIIGEK